MTAPAVAQLALKIKTLVIPVQIERVKKTNFVVTFHNPLKINKNGKQNHTDSIHGDCCWDDFVETQKTVAGIG